MNTPAPAARILVVDDEKGVRTLVAAVLRRAGYNVEVAHDGLAALAAFERERFDLLLSDVRMPGMDGHALAQSVSERHPDTRTALMTGYDGDSLKCEEPRRCETIQKPFRPADLVNFVRAVLGCPPGALPCGRQRYSFHPNW